MSAIAAPPPTKVNEREGERLLSLFNAVRLRYRFFSSLRGLCWTVAFVLVVVLFAGWLDWRLHSPNLVRALLLIGLLTGVGLLAYRVLIRPLQRRMDNLTLAIQIEERYPSLNDSLATTVQLLQDANVVTASPGMRQEAIRRALNKAKNVDFLRIINTRGLRPALLSVLLALVATGLTGFFFPARAQTALCRLADPFGDHPWTVLELEPERDRIGKNEAYEVRGKVRGILPENATVTYHVDGGNPVEIQVKLVKDDEAGTATLALSFRPGQMQTNFRYRVQVNDTVTEWYRVQVLPPPVLTKLGGRASPQLRLEFPEYTQRTPIWLPDGSGNLDVIAGTMVTLRAATDRPLRRAWVEYRPEPSVLRQTAALVPLTAAGPLDAMTATAAGHNIYAPHLAVLDPDKTNFTIRFVPVITGYYRLYFEDELNLHNERVYEVRVRTDPSPTIVLKEPNAQIASLEVLPTATLTLRAEAEDAIFGLRALWVEYRGDGEMPRRIPIIEPERSVANLVFAPLTWPGTNGANEPVRPQRYVALRILPVTALRRPDGSILRPGDVVTLRVCGSDYDNITWDKPFGQSNEVEIRIISQSTLELSLHHEQAKVQQELADLRNLEREAMKKVLEIENRLARTGKLTPEDLVELARAEQMQQQLRERIDNREQESVQTRVQRILETLKQNGMTRSAVQERMEQVSRELDRITRQELDQIEARLNLARKMAEVPENARPQKQAELLDQQADQLEKLARQIEAGEDDKSGRKQEADALKAEAKRLRELAEQIRQGRDADKRKQELERLATEQEKRATELTKKADDRGSREKELEREAKALRDSAKTLRELAEQKSSGDNRDIKAGLTDARRGQEEVEKTLGELLQRLEPWSSSREIKAESRALLEEQRRLLEEVEAMQREGFVGKNREELTPEQKARLDTASANQQKLRERTQELLDKMKRLATDRKESDPATAEELEQAHQRATQGDLTGHMREARQELDNNRLDPAVKAQKATLDELERLAKQLEDRREAELERMIKKQRETEKALLELLDEGEKLRKKIKEAAAIKDPQQRAEALKKLAGEQQQLKEKAEEMARQLSRQRNERAAESLNQAAKQLEEAARTLSRGEVDKEKQEEGLDRIDEALEEVEKARAQNEEELTREQLTRIAEMLKKLKERQERLGEENARIDKQVQQEGMWSRGLLRSLVDLAGNQKSLGEETKTTAERDLGGAIVIQRLVKRAAEAMERAGKRFDEQRTVVVADPKHLKPDEPARQAQAEALRRLQQLLEAIKQEAEAGPRPMNAGGGGGGGAGGGRENDGIPALAQLKLLRTMQNDVNRRTQEFTKQNPDLEKLTPEQKIELESIQREQREVAELIEELIRPSREQ